MLLGMTFAEFAAWGRARVGHHDRFHRAAYRHLLATGRFAPGETPLWQEAEAASPGVIARLSEGIPEHQAPEATDRREAEDPVRGRTVKVLGKLADGSAVESVLIPMGEESHHTVCVSSQVGCKMGCSFCHTATMGLIRSLDPHEIIGQVVTVAAATGIMPRNLVFMGMGEPLDNPVAVGKAVAVLTDPSAFGLAHRHVTVSTVGRADVLPHLAQYGLDRVNLAVSLTAADDGLRSELMPVNRVHPLADLKRALQAVPLRSGRRILVSCVVIPGVTDSPGAVADLVAWCHGLPALVNLIPFNPIPSRPWRAPSEAEVLAVRDRLDAAGIPVRLRLTKGDAVMAACGQLGDPQRRKTRRSPPVVDQHGTA